ncbi:tetratricopeptide repeat protein [Oceanobacillus massiliensis]|uniref:tetratricopeptide repeat protein n=1 Tax=Oceanobacillus massiliensis TaxID=1465765 RepID=UPI0030164293
MNIHQLQNELSIQGFKNAAVFLPKAVQQNGNTVEAIRKIFEDCQEKTLNLSGDIEILYAQVRALSTFDEAYHDILLRDLQFILEELLTPAKDERGIFLEADDLQEAKSIYQQAMLADPDAQFSLGHFYKSFGRDDWALVWFEAATAAGNLDALYWIGNYYFDGIVVGKSFEKAFHCYRKAALEGHPDAMNNYADMYFRGEYVEKDVNRAYELFSQAAERGVPESMYTVGYMYTNGIGTERDLEKAKHWIKQSALSGDSYAANHLGQEAFEADNGEEALRWFQMAADRQDPVGKFNLGYCYESGVGTPVNMKKAKYLYQQAALLGDAEAKERLKDL